MIMKNQLLNLKMIALMCLMMVLGGGANVWAESKTYNYTFKSGDFSTSKLTSTLNGVTWTLNIQWNSSTKKYDWDATKGFKIGSNKYYPTEAVLSTSGIDGTITSIVVNTSGNNDTSAKLGVYVGGKAFDKQQSLTNQATDLSFKGSASGKIELKYSNNKKNVIFIKSIAVTYETAPAKNLTSLAISGEPTKKTYEVGEALEPAGLVVKGTYDDKSTATITDGITWAMNPATLTLNDVSCSVTATVGGVTSPAYNVTGLTVNEAKLPSTTDATFGPDWDKLFGTSYNGQISSVKANKLELNGVSNGVKIKVTNGTSTAGYVKTNDFRLYGNYTITITAPKDVLLSEITMTSQTTKDELKIKENKITSNVGSVKLDGEDLKWIGSSNEIQFEFSDKVSLSTIKVATKAAAAEPTYTPATVNFVAHAGDDYYATFSNANVVFMPKDVTISAVTVDNNNVVMWKSTEGVLGTEETVNIEGTDVAGYYIPANTGVLLNSKNSGEVTYYTVKNKEVAAYSADLDNMLMPSVAGGVFEATDGYKYYKLAYDNFGNETGLGFYWGAPEGGKFFVKAGTAYLAVPVSRAGAKGFAFNGEATGIEGVNANVENAKAIYNLNGQRVASMAKPGLYIVNGKKVVRK